MRRLIALGALAALLLAGPGRADPISLAEMSRYLDGIDEAQSTFTQVNADGTISTGTLYIHRPGRVRFEYDAEGQGLVMAGGGQVAVFDPKSNQPPQQYPLGRTPLSILLAARVDLGRDRMVVGRSSDGATTTVTAQDPQRPDRGTIQLVFSDDPVELRKWTITDQTGTETTVILGDLQTGADLSPRLFNIVQEARARGVR